MANSQSTRRRRRQAPARNQREGTYETIHVRLPEPIYETIHVRLPQPIYDTIIVRPIGQNLGRGTSTGSGAEQGVPDDHPEVQTPSCVTKARQNGNQTIRVHGEIKLMWKHPVVSLGRCRVCQWITLT